MIKKFSTVYRREDKVDFIIDNDKKMEWVANFESNKFKRFFVIIDKEVNKLWGDFLKKRLEKHNKDLFFFEIDPTEQSKSLNFYPNLVNFLEVHKCNLADLVLAIGGGIVIDLVSFTVSTYMRGLPLIMIPTTLIGQVDASTAGKTCLNTEESKNILGTFYYPLVSYNNIHFLKTNSKYHLRQGFSEVFKYGLIGSKRLLTLLEENGLDPLDDILMEVIRIAIEVRIKIRKKDPLVSNLGHTFGHPLEKMSNFKILHGDAISAGTVVALNFGDKMGLISKEDVQNIIKLMKKIGLNLYLEKDINLDRWMDLMLRDKKSSVSHLNLVLICGIEKPYEKNGEIFYKVTPDTVKTFLKEFMENYDYAIKDCAAFINKDNLFYEESNDKKH